MNDREQEEKNAKISYQPPLLPPLTALTITGPLPGGKYLTRPLSVKIAYDDDDEVIVSEPRFHIHAVGSTIAEALAELRYVLAEELDALTADEKELGPRLQLELRYLRGFIKVA